MKNKKKLLALSLVLAIGAVSVVGASFAWYNDTTDTVLKNTFVVGSVKVAQHETDENGAPFVQNAMLLPVLSNQTPEDDTNFIHKVVTVENTGNSTAYVQAFVAVPAALDDSGLLHQHLAGSSDWTAADCDLTSDGVQPKYLAVALDEDGDSNTADVLYNVYKYRYAKELSAGAVSPALLAGIYIDQSADLEIYRNSTSKEIEHAYFVKDDQELASFDAANMKLPVLVATQAVQSEGFADAATALDTVFPSHPWDNP